MDRASYFSTASRRPLIVRWSKTAITLICPKTLLDVLALLGQHARLAPPVSFDSSRWLFSKTIKGHRRRVMRRKQTLAGLVVLCLLASISALGASDKAKVKGMIISRTGETLIVSNANGKTTVVLDDSTKVRHPRGLVGLRKKQVTAAVLIPGLKVSVDGTSDDQNRIVAKTITFDSNDLETAEMIQAGLHPTAEQVAANQKAIGANQQDIAANKDAIAGQSAELASQKQDISTNKQQIDQNIKDIQEANDRFNQLTDYDVKGDLTVNFQSGSSKLSPDDQAKLKQLGQSATSLTGYIVEVKGYADSTGNAAMNTRLSQDRAQAVIDYLIQQCSIPIRHVIAPGAYGETNAVASNETSSGRAENRRVEVKVLVNKAIAGS
jgi:OmpA-OmpF porin, OOP family